jgi:hypothetical protein
MPTARATPCPLRAVRQSASASASLPLPPLYADPEMSHMASLPFLAGPYMMPMMGAPYGFSDEVRWLGRLWPTPACRRHPSVVPLPPPFLSHMILTQRMPVSSNSNVSKVRDLAVGTPPRLFDPGTHSGESFLPCTALRPSHVLDGHERSSHESQCRCVVE